MAQTSGYFDGASYDAQTWGYVMRAISSNGVAAGYLSGLSLAAAGGLNVTLGSGFALNGNGTTGYWYRNDAAVNIGPFATADPSNPRKDTIILRTDTTAKTVTVQVLAGTPASTPVSPTLAQTSTVFEQALWDVLIPAGATAVSTLSDRRSYAGPPLHDIISGHTTTSTTVGQVVRVTGSNTLGLSNVLGSEISASWVGFTPTLVQGGGVSISVAWAQYLLLGRIAHVRIGLTCSTGSVGTAGNNLTIASLPAAVAPTLVHGFQPCGTFVFSDTSASTLYQGSVVPLSTTVLALVTNNTTGYLGANPSLGAALNDQLFMEASWPI
jgi:hypothetical protein